MSEEISVKAKRLGLSHSAVMKVFVFILAIVFLAAAVASGIAAAFCLNYEIYFREEDELREDLLGYAAADYGLAWMALTGNSQGLRDYIDDTNVACAQIQVYGAVQARYTLGEKGEGERFQRVYGYEKNNPYDIYYDIYYDGNQVVDGMENYIVVTVWMDAEPSVYDDYFWGDLVLGLAYDWCNWVILWAAGGLLGFVLCLVFLCRAAGRRWGNPEPCPSWATKVPFDVATAATVAVVGLLIALIVEVIYWEDLFTFAIGLACCIAIAVIVLWWIMSFALRIKLGMLFTNTLIFMVLRLVWRCCKAAARFVRAFFRRFGVVWWAAAGVAVVAILEFPVIMMTRYNVGLELLFWVLKTAVVLVIVVFLAYMLRDLQRMGAALARGEVSYRADTRYMPAPLKNHAESLSSIGQGINLAVNERMKSERMKTELITNVSHDIKTPLTSIINYADLISREETDNPKIHEYAQVLHRQGSRLKRLVEDLVEASKASTGNVEINLVPTQAGVMLMQVAGEYEQRLQQQGLSLVAGQPVHDMTIMADGRRLWRVMDNLMNNICKYAMPGTRVYLSLEDVGSQAVISFKNTSREALNMSADELLERFVRGDAARHGEGSGLGLSIAKSLTELQGGTLEISCDGDLFKAVLKFPIVR